MFCSDMRPTGNGRSRMIVAKPFDIPKREVWEAFKRVKANQGAAGVDGQSIAEFEANRVTASQIAAASLASFLLRLR